MGSIAGVVERVLPHPHPHPHPHPCRERSFAHSLSQRRRLCGISPMKMGENGEVSDGIEGKMRMVLPAQETYVEKAVEVMKAGQPIAVPTNTLYGFACDAWSIAAIHQIYEIKGRKHTSNDSILEKSLNPRLDSIGVPVPNYNFIRKIGHGSGSALALTSANLSGHALEKTAAALRRFGLEDTL
ncbi:hypothetical protein AMTRI_Chr11g95290 [Amborella trichopoda]